MWSLAGAKDKRVKGLWKEKGEQRGIRSHGGVSTVKAHYECVWK
jgi:hypothetical protein